MQTLQVIFPSVRCRYSHGATPTSKVEDMSTILQAYWRVTAKRVCDNACMLLEASFLSSVTDTLETRLLTQSQSMNAQVNTLGARAPFSKEVLIVSYAIERSLQSLQRKMRLSPALFPTL